MRNDVSSNPGKNPSQHQSEDQLARLRSLLVSPEQQDIAVIKERLDNPEIQADDVSRVLAEAIIIRTSRDSKLAQALLPTIEQAIKDSIRKDPKFLANAIFPIIGPAIRKSIAESLRSMIQSLNETLTYAFSWRGLKWRLESIRTGKPFGEIVLLHTLVYRVEQVFLIHRETGLLLEHVAATSSCVKDVDMVSGMLSAIQDFVRDSFGADEKQELQSLNVGEFIVWIEPGSQLALAAVIRGNPPQDLRQEMVEALEKIEFEQSQVLHDFQGDPAPFKSSRHHLEACLVQARYNAQKTANTTSITSPKKDVGSKKSSNLGFEWWILAAAGLIYLLVIVVIVVLS